MNEQLGCNPYLPFRLRRDSEGRSPTLLREFNVAGNAINASNLFECRKAVFYPPPPPRGGELSHILLPRLRTTKLEERVPSSVINGIETHPLPDDCS